MKKLATQIGSYSLVLIFGFLTGYGYAHRRESFCSRDKDGSLWYMWPSPSRAVETVSAPTAASRERIWTGTFWPLGKFQIDASFSNYTADSQWGQWDRALVTIHSPRGDLNEVTTAFVDANRDEVCDGMIVDCHGKRHWYYVDHNLNGSFDERCDIDTGIVYLLIGDRWCRQIKNERELNQIDPQHQPLERHAEVDGVDKIVRLTAENWIVLECAEDQ